MKSLGITRIPGYGWFFFGEPFVRKYRKPDIFEMIRYAKDRGLTDVVLNSNGCLMDEETARRLADSGLDAVYFGIDGFSSETYRQLRVGGSYHKTVENVRWLLKHLQENGLSKPKVFVQFVEMEVNRHEKDDFIRFWSGEGAAVKVRPMVSWAGKVDAPNQVLGREERWPCHWAMQTMSITDAGQVVACAVDLDANFVAGDVTRQTLKEVWSGKLKEFRAIFTGPAGSTCCRPSAAIAATGSRPHSDCHQPAS